MRYAETDQMGVVYHSNYLIWCEVGRTSLLRERGLPYSRLEAAGTLLAVSEASLRFHAGARYDDLVRVETTIAAVRSRKVVFDYSIFRVGGEEPLKPDLLVSASTALVPLGTDRRPRRLPEDVAELLRETAIVGIP